jgi:hypothetical protein
MDQGCCAECGGDLKLSQVNNGKKRCVSCIHQRRIAALLAERFIDSTFSKLWVRGLFKRLGVFLEKHEIPLETSARMLAKAALVFQEADECFRWPQEMHEEWLEGMIERMGRHLFPTFFRAFLIEEQLMAFVGKDEERLKTLKAQIERTPAHYRRLLEVYVNERLAVRERQITQHAKRPLAMKTLVADIEIFSRLTRWLTEYAPELTGWDMIQEEQIHAFLLTLTPKQRELVRKDLLMLFRLARRRRLMTHVPLMDYPSRELPLTVEPLQTAEQKTLARLIRERGYTCPVEALLTSLCLYHGLSSAQICHIKTIHVNLEQSLIYIEERPPVYLLPEDLILLEQFLLKRKEWPYAKSRSHLFISNNAKIDDEPLGHGYVCHKIRQFTGYTPQRLRITCFTALSARYGPQYLVEAFGLSLTQASRYGHIQEFLLEEEIKQQREEFLKLSQHL